MIKKLRLTNFFSFRDETIDFERGVNIAIGINGSGKSNLFKALKLIKTGVEGNNEDTALQELIVSKYGGFDSIYCKASDRSDFANTIGLEFTLNKEVLSQYGNGTMEFRDDVIYKIVLIRKADIGNYFVSEKISTDAGYTYLDFMNGRGKVRERTGSKKINYIEYDDYNPHELSLSKISEFDADRYLPLVIIKRALRDIQVYNYFDTTENSKLRQSMSATTSVKQLLPDGTNLPQILNTIKIRNKNAYREIQESLKDVNPFFNGFDFNVLGSGVFELMLDENELNSAVHITHVSDGTLRYLCLMAIIYNPARGKLICIDEPEVGLHPDMIFNVSRAIRKASEESMFIIATHSVEFLNYFGLENILVFEKNESNSSLVNQFEEKDFEGWYEKYLPGKMWVAGDIGGKRW